MPKVFTNRAGWSKPRATLASMARKEPKLKGIRRAKLKPLQGFQWQMEKVRTLTPRSLGIKLRGVKGKTYQFKSSWVSRFRHILYPYTGKQRFTFYGQLQIIFKDRSGRETVCCQYENVPVTMYESLRHVPSKGRWVHKYLGHIVNQGWHWPYVIVFGALGTTKGWMGPSLPKP